jgi:hypothetical protein
MKINIGSADRAVRIVLALILFGWGLYAHTWLGLIGLVPFLTAIIGVCPLYVPFKFSTVPKAKPKAK